MNVNCYNWRYNYERHNTSEKILEIRVKYDDAIRKIAEYRTQLDILRKVEQTLKEDLKKGRMSRRNIILN